MIFIMEVPHIKYQYLVRMGHKPLLNWKGKGEYGPLVRLEGKENWKT